MTGKIKRLMDKGYGFIESDEVENDLFFHAKELSDDVDFYSLQEGQAVTFEVEETPKGMNAVNVQLA